MKLDKSFYQRDDVVLIAKELLGKYLYTCLDGKIITGGIITETEAYAGAIDKASHAYQNRRTKRTEVMFHAGGVAYVYLCYGMHALFNVVTNKKDIPDAVLIRGIHPTVGVNVMLSRMNKTRVVEDFTNGPGKVTKALGIDCKHTAIDLTGNKIWLEDKEFVVKEKDIIKTTRIGVDYAKEDALLPYRFIINL